MLVFFWLRRRAPHVPQTTAQPAGEALALSPFLAIVGFGPLLLTLAIAALSGAYLLVGWGTTFHVVLTLWLVAARPFAIAAPQDLLRRAAIVCIALQALLWTLVTANGGTLPNLRRLSPVRTAPAPPELADAVRRVWGEHSTAPLRYVLSEKRIGASLAVQFRGAPRIVDARRGDLEAVLPAAVRAACGYVVVPDQAPRARTRLARARSTRRPVRQRRRQPSCSRHDPALWPRASFSSDSASPHRARSARPSAEPHAPHRCAR